MAEPTTTPDTSTKPKASEIIAERDKTIAELRDQLAETTAAKKKLEDFAGKLALERKRDEEAATARAAEREKAIANNDPPKLIGTINVYLQDNPQDIVDRARPLFEGRVPIDRATKFKIDGKLTLSREWPLFKRLGLSPKVGETFDVGEIPADEIAHYAAQGVIVAVA